MRRTLVALITSASVAAGGAAGFVIAAAQSRPPGTTSCFGPWSSAEETHDDYVWVYGHVDLHVTYRYNLPCGWFMVDSVTPGCTVDGGTCGEHAQGISGKNPGDDITVWSTQKIDRPAGIGSDQYECRIFFKGARWTQPDVSGWCR